ncbi:unnamed protein product [Candidula unifasciata]|uniref:Resistance to inhibitors of cholinesterase protein 3 N-terminal domain-containing protein n=1 Tax=Candidula unifasciata TaxID=100452 RepID=A0A8S3YW87_9EUPU|nr:unnamed protein product [Candidula unifasciata]
MATFRVLCAVTVMISCCVIMYPRFVHPFVLQILGMSELPKTNVDESVYPPHYRTQNPEKHKPQVSPEDPRKNTRSAPHPGLRAAADMQKQTQAGSGRGMIGMVLPMYAIGIIVYLLYTLFKVFNKSKNNNWNRERGQVGSRNKANNSLDRMGFPLTLDSGGDVRSFLQDQQQKQQLEDLLARMDNKNVSLSEMKLLQKRLEETEAQMSRILQAMQMVQTNVDHMGAPEQEEQHQVTFRVHLQSCQVAAKTQLNDLSPDVESYELVDRQGEVVEAKDKEERNNKISRKEGQTNIQKQGAIESNSECVKPRSQTSRLCKEVDFDDIDKDSEDDIECVSEEEEAEVTSPNEDIENSNEDASEQTECLESGVRQRRKADVK